MRDIMASQSGGLKNPSPIEGVWVTRKRSKNSISVLERGKKKGRLEEDDYKEVMRVFSRISTC